ncbi:SpoIIE family protein phosphatase [bacterium]|nr:SpoIIE family protein phosphatase [bacterium]MBU1994442.1 SpoIIE family protein phosphatase [bacterium]
MPLQHTILEIDKKLQKYKDKEIYNSYQEELGFAKELNILRNDFYYKMIENTTPLLVDFLYKPLDIMSGDAYTAREIDKNRTFYLIIDGMGKGLSASLTAMLMSAFINHLIDKMKMYDSFDLNILIRESLEYIQPILLDEEALAIDYILINNYFATMEYAKFAMPAILLKTDDNLIVKIKSNNPPMSKYQNTFEISLYNISNISKFLFYSDGVVENVTCIDAKPYADFIQEDFSNSFTKEDLREKIFQKIKIQEDDLTLIFINKLESFENSIHKKEFGSSLEEVQNASEWYDKLFEDLSQNTEVSFHASLVFTELFMNAFEHGSLRLDASQKHLLIQNDEYMDKLTELSKSCNKKIIVQLNRTEYSDNSYIITKISDEGIGFNTQLLSKIFRNAKTFNGRGVFVSRKNSLGIYYNSQGNSVLYIHKI